MMSANNPRQQYFIACPLTGIQEQVSHPGRVAGLHFFNPAQIMKLVEVVKAAQRYVDQVISILNWSICSHPNEKRHPVFALMHPVSL
jgi:hypothetical protein